MTIRLHLLAATLFVALWATHAHAQDPVDEEPADDANGEEPAEAKDEEASDAQAKSQKLFGQAAEHYREGRFSVAATLLEEAYGLHAEPIILYNLGRAHESDGKGQEAIDAYTRYLAVGEPTDRAGVEARIARLSKRLEKDAELEQLRAKEKDAKEKETKEAEAARKEALAQPVVAPIVPGPLDNSPGDRGNRSLLGPALVATVGVVVLAGAAGTAFVASREFDNAESAPNQQQAASKKDRADMLAVGANIGFGVGSAVLAAGVIWALVRSNDSSGGQAESRNVSFAVSPGGFVLSGHFDWPLQ